MPIPHYANAPIVFFDVDHVLYDGNFGLDLAKRLARGFKALKALTKTTAALVKYRTGRAPVDDIVAAAIRLFEGEKASTLEPRLRETVRTHLFVRIFAETEEAVHRYAEQETPIVLFSSAPTPAVSELAREVGATHAEGTTAEMDAAGCLTDRPRKPLPHGEGKVLIAERICNELGLALDQAAYYADGESDLPLMRRVGFPVCINARKQMLVVGRERGWPLYEVADRRGS